MAISCRKAILSRPLSCSFGWIWGPSTHLHNWPILHKKWTHLAEKPFCHGLCHVCWVVLGPSLHLPDWPILYNKWPYFAEKTSHHGLCHVFFGWIWSSSLRLHNWPVLKKNEHIWPKSHHIAASVTFVWVDMGSISTIGLFCIRKWTYFAENPFYHGLCHVCLGGYGVHVYISTRVLFCQVHLRA